MIIYKNTQYSICFYSFSKYENPKRISTKVYNKIGVEIGDIFILLEKGLKDEHGSDYVKIYLPKVNMVGAICTSIRYLTKSYKMIMV